MIKNTCVKKEVIIMIIIVMDLPTMKYEDTEIV